MTVAADIARALTDADIAAAKALFLAYADELGFDLCFQGFDREIATFPAVYAEPGGLLLLARSGGEATGTVGLRALSPGICEMKRLYVRPQDRGSGLGRELAVSMIEEARALGYGTMRLDTHIDITAAQALYRDLGFAPIGAYNDPLIDGILHFELALSASESDSSRE